LAEKQDEYINALIKEIECFYEYEELKTLYIGGGTPSLLSLENLTKLLSVLNYGTGAELTVEINPETVSENYLTGLKELGVNRLSFGCQTFDENILKIIGRRHSPGQVNDNVKLAQNIGFDNINLDFIYGLPTQTIDGFTKDLEKAMSLGIQHVSLYGLKIDEGCYFYKTPPESLPDNDIQADMYLNAIKILTGGGFCHYEISNFAIKGYHSRHNMNYWDNNSYYGFGVSAHGYTGKVRYSNTESLSEYLLKPDRHKEENILTRQEQLEEEIFLGFRRMSGINVENINQKYSIDFEHSYRPVLDKYLSSSHLIKTENGYKLSREGILVSNIILSEFLD